MYLIMQARFNDEFGGDGPELMFLKSDKQDSPKFGFLDACTAQAKKVMETADPNLPKPDKLVFANYAPTWIKYDDRMEECDFWPALKEKEAVLVKSLPEFFSEDELEVRQDYTTIEVTPVFVNVSKSIEVSQADQDDRQEVRYTSVIKHTDVEMWTDHIAPDTIAQLPVFEGKLLADDWHDNLYWDNAGRLTADKSEQAAGRPEVLKFERVMGDEAIYVGYGLESEAIMAYQIDRNLKALQSAVTLDELLSKLSAPEKPEEGSAQTTTESREPFGITLDEIARGANDEMPPSPLKAKARTRSFGPGC